QPLHEGRVLGHAAKGEAAGRVGEEIGHDGVAQTRPRGSKIFEIAIELRARDSSRGKAEDVGVGNDIAQTAAAAHARALEVRLEPGDKAVMELPVIAETTAGKKAVELRIDDPGGAQSRGR